MDLVGIPETGLYRAGRWADVEAYPEPAQRIPLTTRLLDGYRWEDPLGEFATVKCSATAEGAIGRTIARYRRREFQDGSGIIDAILSFLEGEPDGGEPDLADGRVPEDVFDDLYLIHVPADRGVVFVDIEAEATRDALEKQLGPTLSALGVGPLSANLPREEDRRVTRLVLRTLYGLFADGRSGPVAGIRYSGQPDPEWDAFVLWSPPKLVEFTGDDVGFRWVARWDEDLLAAARRLGVKVGSTPSSGP